MSDHCCSHDPQPEALNDIRYRRALWAALVINGFMFVLEIAGAMRSGSASLLADSVDFFGDAANYGVSLLVLTMGLLWRSRAALLKGWCMAAFGVFVLVRTGWSIAGGEAPEPLTMGVVGMLALLANLTVAALLYAFRAGDANMRSVWLCTRNDAIGNLAVLLAAAGVLGTGSGWADWATALLMAVLALSAARAVLRQAGAEHRTAVAMQHRHGHAAP